jgi:hypothetical protein
MGENSEYRAIERPTSTTTRNGERLSDASNAHAYYCSAWPRAAIIASFQPCVQRAAVLVRLVLLFWVVSSGWG